MAPDAKHAFISYVKEDKAEVDRLCHILERAGIPYWRDRTDLAPGDAWKAKIREAIRSGSLVFLACFSEQTRARAQGKSYMNEELTLAVEESRQRAPGATWLIPVRFDDGKVPEWDLGAGRFLDDLNYADLFGNDYAAEVAGLLKTIGNVMNVSPSESAQAVASVESAGASERPALMRRATKDMLFDPTRRIQLDDLVKQETRRVIAALEGPDALPLSVDAGDQNDHALLVVDRARELVQLVEPLAYSMQVAAHWADQETIGVWSTALRSIAAVGTTPTSGYTDLIALRSLPGLYLMLTGAIAAHAAGRWDNFRALTTLTIPDARGTSVPLVNALSPWTPLDDNVYVASLLALSALDGSDTDVHAKSLREGRTQNLPTPVSDWLLRSLAPLFDEQFTASGEFEKEFNATETFLGVVAQDAANQNESPWVRGALWFGRDTWKDRHRSNDVVDSLISVFAAEGSNWGPLRAGLFGEDPQRARHALADYSENFKHIAGSRF